MILENYGPTGGIHPETATLKNALAYQGVRAPHTGEPYSEAMLLGLGGGLGSTYILWEFKSHELPIIVMGFQNRFNYPLKFMGDLCRRVGARMEVLETAGVKKAAANLEAALASGRPAITWVDFSQDPYYRYYLLSTVNVFGIDSQEGIYLVDDRARQPFRIPEKTFVAARKLVPSYKNRILLVEPGPVPDLAQSILEGIEENLNYLGSKSDSFSLPALRKWGRLMTDSNNKKGWMRVFKDRIGLYRSLKSVYYSIEFGGTGGGGMRGLYADFLDEAAEVVSNPGLAEVAETYRQLAGQWRELAEAALPDEVAEFKETKGLMARQQDTLMEKGGQALPEIQPLTDKLTQFEAELNYDFPLPESATWELFSELQERLYGLYKAEKAALQTLAEAAQPD